MRIVFYANARGRLLTLDWLRELRKRDRLAFVHTAAVLHELGARGRELGPPAVCHVADGLHELRPVVRGSGKPLVFFFDGDDAVVLGPAKRAEGPMALDSIVRACRHRRLYERDPQGHSHDASPDTEEF